MVWPDGISNSTSFLFDEKETILARVPALRQIEKEPKGKADKLLITAPFGNLYKGAIIDAGLFESKTIVPKLDILFDGGFIYIKSPGRESLETGR